MCFNIFLQLQLSLPAEDLNDQRIDNICRNQSVLYYGCTNFFLEIEQEDELRKYGKSKEHRPSPIVGLVCLWMQMGFRLPLTSIQEIRMSRQP